MLETIDIDSLTLAQSIMIFLADPVVLLCIAIDLFIIIHLRSNPPDWHAKAANLYVRPWSVLEAETMILVIISFILSGRVLLSIMVNTGSIPAEKMASCQIVVQTVLFHAPAIGMALVLMFRNRIPGTGMLGYQTGDIRMAFRRGFVFCLASLPVVGLATLVQNFLLKQAGYHEEPQYVIELFSTPGPLWLKGYLVFVTLVTAPIAEEFTFRGIGISALSGRIGMPWTVCLVSVAFAMIHFNLYSFIPLLVIAVAFSLAYIYTGSLLVPVIMHSIFNAINLSALFLSSHM